MGRMDVKSGGAVRLQATADRSRIARILSRLMRRPEFGALVGTLAVFVFFAVATAGNGFLAWRGVTGWLNVASELGIVAVPVALLMIGATSVLIATASGLYGVPLWLSIALAIALGVSVGLFNGVLTIRTGLPSFIITLVSMLALAGSALGMARLLAGTPNVSLKVEGPCARCSPGAGSRRTYRSSGGPRSRSRPHGCCSARRSATGSLPPAATLGPRASRASAPTE